MTTDLALRPERHSRWRIIVAAVLLALGISTSLALAPEGSPVAPPTASASHGYDTYVSASCGMAGGAGTVRTTVYLDYSASKASFRIDRVKVENLSERTVTVDLAFRADIYTNYPQLNNLSLPPGHYYNDLIFHDSWWRGVAGFQYVRAEYFWGSYQTQHDLMTKWPPSVGDCSHWYGNTQL